MEPITISRIVSYASKVLKRVGDAAVEKCLDSIQKYLKDRFPNIDIDNFLKKPESKNREEKFRKALNSSGAANDDKLVTMINELKDKLQKISPEKLQHAGISTRIKTGDISFSIDQSTKFHVRRDLNLNIVKNEKQPIDLLSGKKSSRCDAALWEFNDIWKYDSGEIAATGPDTSQFSAPYDYLRDYSVCLCKGDVISEGSFEATVRVYLLERGIAGLVARFEKVKNPSGIALIISGINADNIVKAHLLTLRRGKLCIVENSKLDNVSSYTDGIRLRLKFQPRSVIGYADHRKLFDVKDNIYEGAGYVGFIKFGGTNCRFSDPVCSR